MIIGVAILFGAIALYLIGIAYTLHKVNFALGTVLIGVRAIAYQTEPVEQVVGGIASDVSAIEKALQDLLSMIPGNARLPAPRPAATGRPAATASRTTRRLSRR